MQFGVYRGAGKDGVAGVSTFEQWLGRPVNFAIEFTDWQNGGWASLSGPDWMLRPWADAKRQLLLCACLIPKGDPATLQDIANGKTDATWSALADQLVRFMQSDAIIRIGHEMDGGWYPWKAPQGSGLEPAFAAAFRKVVTVMRARQPYARFKFCLNFATAWSDPAYLSAVYPGDDFVDFIGLDFYDRSWVSNTYPIPLNADPLDLLSRRRIAWDANVVWRLERLRQFASDHRKDFIIPEWGCWHGDHGGEDSAYFVHQVADWFEENGVAMSAYFDFSSARLSADPAPLPLAAAAFTARFK